MLLRLLLSLGAAIVHDSFLTTWPPKRLRFLLLDWLGIAF